MWDYFIVVFLLLLYVALGVWILRLIWRGTLDMKRLPKAILRSEFGAMLFGITLFRTGGDPGFGFPCPVIISFILGSKPPLLTVILPFVLWWLLIFLILFITNHKHLSKPV